MTRRILLVAALCLLAGCGGAAVSDSTNTPAPAAGATDSPAPTASPTTSETPTPTETPTATAAPRGSAENPITLAYRVTADARDGDYETIVNQMVRTYQTLGPSIVDRPANFEVIDDTAEADVVVVFEPAVRRCGDDRVEGTFFYCADGSLETSSVEQAIVRVPTRYRSTGIREMLNAGVAVLGGVSYPPDVDALDYNPDTEYEYHDPWPGNEPVTVSVNNSIAPDRSLVPLVRETLSYWEANQSQYGDYQVDWEFEPDSEDADVEVRLVTDVGTCGGIASDTFIGCASRLEPTYLADDQEVVRVGARYTDETTVQILKHEFGHLYGRTHGESPMPVMAATQQTELLPRPNVSEKPYAFESQPLEVYIDYSTFSESDSRIRAQIEHVVEFYNNHPGEYHPDSVDVTFTRSKEDAEVVIEEADVDCSGSGGCSNSFYYGTDSDGDQAFETYSTLYIQLSDLDVETYGYHTGYWLTSAYQSYPRPDVFAPDADYNERRDWW